MITDEQIAQLRATGEVTLVVTDPAVKLAKRHKLPVLLRWHAMIVGKPQADILRRAIAFRVGIADDSEFEKIARLV